MKTLNVLRGHYPVCAARCIALCPNLPSEIRAHAASQTGEGMKETARLGKPAVFAPG
jgi:hypothetical protein